MGKKGGGGRKAFLRSAKGVQGDGEEEAAEKQLLEPESRKPTQHELPGEDPSAKFLVSAPDVSESQRLSNGQSNELQTNAKDVDTGNAGSDPQAKDESRGHLIQRHKRVCIASQICDVVSRKE